MHFLRVTLMLTGVAVLTVGGFVATAAETEEIPARTLHEGTGAPRSHGEHWVAVAQSADELAAEWAQLHQAGMMPEIDFEHEFVVVTSRIVPCLGPLRAKTLSLQDGALIVKVAEAESGGCAAMLDRHEWAAAVERNALRGSVAAVSLVGPDGDELARIDVSIPGPPAPDPTLPETGLPVVTLLALALASLAVGRKLTLRTNRRSWLALNTEPDDALREVNGSVD